MNKFTNEVWFVGAEMSPLVKAGGLGDVMGSLPKFLIRKGIDVRVVIPYYKNIIKNECLNIESSYPPGRVNFGEIPFDFGIKTARTDNGIPLVLIEQNHFFNREYVYGSHAGVSEYKDNLWRFAMLAHGAVHAMRVIGIPGVIHSHDWSAGFTPAVARHAFGDEKASRPALIFTIHNLGYQGVYPMDDFYDIGIDFKYNSPSGYEHFGALNSLKGGMLLSDVTTTVSPTYASEITTPRFGFGLEGELKRLYDKGKLKGILNGIDLDYWSPQIDKMIHYRLQNKNESYSLKDYGKWADFKSKNKGSLLNELNLPIRHGKGGKTLPLIGVVSRFAPEKGIDIFLDSLFNWDNFPFHVVMLGSGNSKIEEKAKYLAEIRKDRVCAIVGYDEAMAHKIYAAADIFIMPSKTEPCGLSQMIAMRYGGVIAAGDTGGLHDSVSDMMDKGVKNPTGILIKHMDVNGISWAIDKLYNIYMDENGEKWKSLVINASNQRFGWDDSAAIYENLYHDAISPGY